MPSYGSVMSALRLVSVPFANIHQGTSLGVSLMSPIEDLPTMAQKTTICVYTLNIPIPDLDNSGTPIITPPPSGATATPTLTVVDSTSDETVIKTTCSSSAIYTMTSLPVVTEPMSSGDDILVTPPPPTAVTSAPLVMTVVDSVIEKITIETVVKYGVDDKVTSSDVSRDVTVAAPISPLTPLACSPTPWVTSEVTDSGEEITSKGQ